MSSFRRYTSSNMTDGRLFYLREVEAHAPYAPRHKGQDAKQGLAGTESGAVGSEADETPNHSQDPTHVYK